MIERVKTAFTLVELLVVIAIVGILSGLIIVGMSNSVSSANTAKAQIFAASMRDSMLSNLISEWKFNEAAGTTTNDNWSGGNNCTFADDGGSCPTSCPQWQTTGCVYGNCLSFNGTGAYLNCSNNSNLNITGDISIAFWINSNNLTGTHGILSRGVYGSTGVPYAVSTSANKISFSYVRTDGGGVSYSSNFTLSTNSWIWCILLPNATS